MSYLEYCIFNGDVFLAAFFICGISLLISGMFLAIEDHIGGKATLAFLFAGLLSIFMVVVTPSCEQARQMYLFQNSGDKTAFIAGMNAELERNGS